MESAPLMPSPSLQGAAGPILAINAGSSSIKFALFGSAATSDRELSGKIDRIGAPGATWTLHQGESSAQPETIAAPTYADAAGLLIARLGGLLRGRSIVGIGHRIVHGGTKYSQPMRITSEVLADLRGLISLAPEHLPGQVELIEAFTRAWPTVPQIACFDTAFHADMPRVAKILAVPRRLAALGVRRYGFHGLSYSYLIEELHRVAGAEAANGRLIFAHLGNGASMAAVHRGKSIETTMGMTPTAGLPMSTRSGDLDPGLSWFLARTEAMTPEQFFVMVNTQSGLLGISEISSDVRDLLARESSDPRAAEAIEFFCYQCRKWIGGLAAVLQGLDTLVFSGGIGENAVELRARICDRLGWLGVSLDAKQNASGAGVISTLESRVTVRVLRTDEETMIARSVDRTLDLRSAGSK